jgi:hypothetical protein
MMRGLAYCGSAGAALWRASHNPFFVRIPFAMHMEALERAHPDMPPATLLAKAHAQLCLDLQRKEAMNSFAADAIDPSSFDASEENLMRFFEGRRVYEARYRPLARRDPAAAKLVQEFDYWCLKKGSAGAANSSNCSSADARPRDALPASRLPNFSREDQPHHANL